MRELSQIFRLFLIAPKNPYLNQATQEILAKIFLPKKIPKTKISTRPPQNPSIIPVTWNLDYSLYPPLAFHSHFLYIWLSASCW